MLVDDGDLVTIAEGASVYGCHPATLFRRIADGELIAFLGPDRRRRYVRRSDIERMKQPTPITRAEPRAATPRTAR